MKMADYLSDRADDPSERDMLLCYFSDAYEDAYGIRPRYPHPFMTWDNPRLNREIGLLHDIAMDRDWEPEEFNYSAPDAYGAFLASLSDAGKDPDKLEMLPLREASRRKKDYADSAERRYCSRRKDRSWKGFRQTKYKAPTELDYKKSGITKIT